MNAIHTDRWSGRIEICADDPSITPYAGLVVTGELVERLRVVELINAELMTNRHSAPVKERNRGVSPGELVVCLAETQLGGGDCFSDLDDLRYDEAGRWLRAIAPVPAPTTALGLTKRFRRSHLQAVERALARAGEAFDRELGREPTASVTIDLDAIGIEVYGPQKEGARPSYTGDLAYQAHVATWAERGRSLCSELMPGNRAKLTGEEAARLCRRAKRLLPDEHGDLTFRLDSGYYSAELMNAIDEARARFTVCVPRYETIWRAVETIPDHKWRPAISMPGAEVAETTYVSAGWKGAPLRLIVRRVRQLAASISRSEKARRRRTVPKGQLELALQGEVAEVLCYSFIATNIEGTDATQLEHFHRHRAQIEERLKELKLGQALRHLPSGDMNANRVWLQGALTALNLTAMVCDLCPACAASGVDDQQYPLRRAAKTLRRILFSVPARIVRTARTLTMRLPEGFRYAEAFRATYTAALSLPGP